MTNQNYISSTHGTVGNNANASGLTWDDYFGAWLGATLYDNNHKTEAPVIEERCVDHTPSALTIEAYNKFVEEHILPEPEQCMCASQDFVEAASAGTENFEPTLGELPDATPEPRPEMDAELTKVEKEAVIEAVTETKVKATTVKKKAGRPRKKA